MKNLKATTAIVLSLAGGPALADPTFGVSLVFNFGGGKPISPGISAKIYSDNTADSIVGAAGATWFFDGGYFGFDAGLGYLSSDDWALTLTYDFINDRPQFGLGYVDVC